MGWRWRFTCHECGSRKRREVVELLSQFRCFMIEQGLGGEVRQGCKGVYEYIA